LLDTSWTTGYFSNTLESKWKIQTEKEIDINYRILTEKQFITSYSIFTEKYLQTSYILHVKYLEATTSWKIEAEQVIRISSKILTFKELQTAWRKAITSRRFTFKNYISGKLNRRFGLEYHITDKDYISRRFTSIYGFSEEGIRGVSERISGTFNPWQIVHTDVNIHPHLYNTYESETNTTYERYYILTAEVKSLVSRELIYTEVNNTYEFYSVEGEGRRAFLHSSEEHTDERSVTLEITYEESGERYTVSSQQVMLVDERINVFWSIYDTFRYAYAKSWYVDEKFVITHARDKFRQADQRFCIAQTEENVFSGIIQQFVESCATQFSFTVSPKTTDFEIGTIDPQYRDIFTDEIVTPDLITFNILDLEDKFSDLDFFFIDATDNKNVSVNMGTNSMYLATTYQITGTDSKYIDGFFACPQEGLVHFMIWLEISNYRKSEYGTPQEFLDYLRSKGYIKITTMGEDLQTIPQIYDWTYPRLSLVPIRMEFHKDLIKECGVRLRVRWGYPIITQRIYDSLILIK